MHTATTSPTGRMVLVNGAAWIEMPTELRQHHEDETREMIGYTLGMIKDRHPEWTRNDSARQMCWDYFRKLPAT